MGMASSSARIACSRPSNPHLIADEAGTGELLSHPQRSASDVAELHQHFCTIGRVVRFPARH
jgi:hypothetical protein